MALERGQHVAFTWGGKDYTGYVDSEGEPGWVIVKGVKMGHPFESVVAVRSDDLKPI